MAFSKTNAPVAPAAAAPATEVAPATAAVPSLAATVSVSTVKPYVDTKVKGQVAMHAIIAGYETASRLVLTLSPKPTEARDLLHTLAAEIAAKVEAYSFHE